MDAARLYPTISAGELQQILHARNGEMALLDVREEGAFADGHILLASSLPLSQLDSGIALLVPRKATLIILCDDGVGLAQTAHQRLTALGYENVVILDGGMPGWTSDNHEIFAGVHVPTKALGLFAQRELSIPEISPNEYARLEEDGSRFLVLDCRPFSEYQRGTIPAALNSPGMETVHQMHGIEGGTHLVMSCAGRTRGLIAAQTLRDFGFQGNISALRGGTMSWALSGRAIRKDASQSWKPKCPAKAPGRDIVTSLAHRAQISILDAAACEQWKSDKSRTFYTFDIRQYTEYEAGHIPGARHVPGAQLIHAFDRFVGTRGARIVLSDDDGVRAAGTALWLRRMGWKDVGIIYISAFADLERGPSLPEGNPGGMAATPVSTAPDRPAMQAYLARSDDLLEKVARDGTLPLAAIAVN
ncbi:MAG: hypothetical protein RJB62_1759 [Pseudomonadota bacterium]|jgi:rhodanese-related sulfurtransferase